MAERAGASMVIDADPGSILDVIADLESYPQWSSSITAVRILAEDDLGWVDQAELTLEHPMFKDTYALDYTWDVEEDGVGVVSWALLRGEVITLMDGSYTLTATADGRTEVTYDLEFDVSVPMPVAIKRKVEETIIDSALRELKTRVEG
ncbi:MAG: SRPBCC family protein [Austwickia sp.]|jgi:ribosome-associated toxin RatA of RatAB toxin-antitoxin module|nr:SRPBCC family protein [Austwickia sp.]MBK8435586.1 SRPBCC family protein [Austwickia sp.]MBK9100844.1 SRPBCC family protein [Austwickia sp.]